MSWLKLIDIHKKIDNDYILKGINIDIKQGEMVSVLGPSGCGKTTTLRILAGIIKADSGKIIINNQDVSALPAQKRGAVLVFQDYLLFPHLSFKKNIAFGLKARKLPKEQIKVQVENLIDLVELNDLEDRLPYQLSGGQQQRVALARALAINPDLLLLDEPFSNLDNRLRQSMQDLIRKIHRETKTTIILVTHSKEEAFKMSDKIVLMFDGKVAQVGSPFELYKKPNSLNAAKFLGESYCIKALVKKGIAQTVFGNSPLNLADGAYDLYYRLAAFFEDRQGLACTIRAVNYLGDIFVYNLEAADGSIIACAINKEMKIGEQVRINAHLDDYIFANAIKS